MPEYNDLIAAAYRAERAAGRRLAERAGIDQPRALRLTLEQAAGAQGLQHLHTARAQARQTEADRRAARAREQAARLALRQPARPAPHAWQAWFDGSAHPNPGRIGIGAVLAGPAGERIEISRPGGHGNSGEAEYGALIAVMEAALALHPAELIVYGDSKVVIDDVNRRTARGAKGLERQRAAADALLARLGKVTLQWIPRHRNGAADRLSQQAAGAWHGDAPAPPEGRHDAG